MHLTKLQDDKSLRETYKEFLTLTLEESANGDKLFSKDRLLCIRHIANIEGLALQIGNSQDDCFEVKAGRLVEVNKIGKQIIRILSPYFNRFDDYLMNSLVNFQVSPNAMVLMEEFNKIEARRLVEFRSIRPDAVCDRLNEAVSAIREKINTPEFRKQMHNFRRSSDKNLKSFRLYIEKCFEIYSRLLVLRIDLYYKLGTFAEKSLDDSFKIAQQHWQKWIRRFKNKMDKAYVGYVKILEYGYQKSLHFHVLLLLDGSLVRQDITIATLAGKDWSDVVTQGAGRSHNCHLKKEYYRRLGIGMIHANDKDAQAALNDIMAYMIKIDYFIKLVTPDGSRVFSKGDMPRAKLKSGRPRRTSVT